MRIVWAIEQDIVEKKIFLKEKKKTQMYFYIIKSETKKVIPL